MTAVQTSNAGMPALPSGRTASGLRESLIPGNAALERGPGTQDDDNGLLLSAEEGVLAWALYGFDPGSRSADSISVLLSMPPGSAAWIALPDYELGRWEWHGPFNTAKTLAIDEARYLSPSGQLHCLLSNSSGTPFTVNALSFRTWSAFNAVPTASLSADLTSGPAPLSVNFDASGSVDSDGRIAFYLWDLDGDAAFELTSLEPHASSKFPLPGQNTVTVAAVDDEGGYGLAELELSVDTPPSAAPLALLTADRQSGLAPFVVNFDASASSDPDGEILLHEWDFDGDGSFDAYGPAPQAQHVYPLRGTYTARLRVTDNDGLQAEASLQLTLPGEWSQFGMDLSHSRQSPYNGPAGKALHWSFDTGDDVFSSPSLAPDGTVYIGSLDFSLYAINPDGSLKWSFPTGGIVYSSAAIADDGTIYFGSDDYSLYALNPDGSLKWKFETGFTVFSSPAVGRDGTIYFGSLDNHLYALSPDGTQKWAFAAGDWVRSSPAIAADGTVYFGSYDYSFYALNPDGSLKWSFPTGKGIYDSPAIGSDGTVYFGSFDDNFYALNPDGSLQWSYPLNDNISCSPSIAADGTIYVGGWDTNMYALSPQGELKWTFPTGHWVVSSPAIGANGNIYFGSADHRVYCLSPDGSLQWQYGTGNWVRSSPAIAADGTLYIGSEDGRLYAFGS
ncbi:PQQ-binding-like beta-propeller repeat protein [bacterium]|nr:PQQ-binding-like beta-propeller repeat protein [bacterium]